MIFQMIPNDIKMNILGSDETGQALIELMLMVLISLIFAFGIFETAIFFHNVSVMDRALSTATTYASRGAPKSEIQEVIVSEARNIMTGAWLVQRITSDGVYISIHNPRTNKLLSPTKHSTEFPPHSNRVAPYIFWANGYEIRVGVGYEIGIYIPFLRTYVVEFPIYNSALIQASNDMDRDGMADWAEQNYVDWAIREDGFDTEWTHPIHRDRTQSFDTVSGVDIDGDGLTSGDTFPYDFDNDGLEDKFDYRGQNAIRYNPLIADTSVGNNGWLIP